MASETWLLVMPVWGKHQLYNLVELKRPKVKTHRMD
jgi:hypothetical protein